MRYLLTFMLLTLGCSATAPPDYQNVKIDTSALKAAATVGPGDAFEVRVYGHKDLTSDHQVGPDGAINFPHIGVVHVGGLTPMQIGTTIEDKLRDGYLLHPSVTVFVKQFKSKKVFVLGQVRKPGMFDYQDNMSIVQAITMAGGFATLAAKNYAIVKRRSKGVETQIPVPVEKIMTEKGSANFLLQPDDIIYVPEAIL